MGLKEKKSINVNSSRKKIYLPPLSPSSIGGPTTFMKNLFEFLERQQISFSEHYEHSKVIFFPISFSLKALESVKQKGGYIIQRLDGIFYPSKHGDAYAEQNETIQRIYSLYADFVIFQSEYSRKQCFEMFGQRENSKIILNGVQKQIFYPPAKSRNAAIDGSVQFVTSGNFRNLDMLEPIVQALDSLRRTFDFTLTVIGPVTDSSLFPYLDRDYVRHVGSKTLDEIANILRHSDIFLYSHLNPPCPNSVLEAISCGLPVVGFDSGAMAELCYFSKELLAYVSEDIFQKYEDFDAQKLARKIALAVENYAQYRELALAHSHLYSFEECGRHYLEIFEHYLHKPRKIVPVLTYLFKRLMQNIRSFPRRLKGAIANRLTLPKNSFVERLLLRLDRQRFITILARVLAKKSSSLPPKKALKMLFELENRFYALEGQNFVRYGNGLHSKHRHIQYHDFFVQRIEAGSRVLDVKCGTGALAHDIATQGDKVSVYGIDIVEQNITTAREHYAAPNLEFVCGDALHELPDQTFDIIVLSNVLEHLEKRVDFLQRLNQRYRPKKFLISVPMYERDWRVPLKEELRLDYRLEATHYIEYRQHEFLEEITQAGLALRYSQINWGEIWAEVCNAES